MERTSTVTKDFDPSLSVQCCSCENTASKREIVAKDVNWARCPRGWICSRCFPPLTEGIGRLHPGCVKNDCQYQVPCPNCHHLQPFEFRSFIWSAKGNRKVDSVQYMCSKCRALIPETEKTAMVAAGSWVSIDGDENLAAPGVTCLYSPWISWTEIIEDFLEAKNNVLLLKSFVREVLGLPWDPRRAGPEIEGELAPESLLAEALCITDDQLDSDLDSVDYTNHGE